MGRSHQAHGIWMLRHCINTKKTVKYLAKCELRKQLAETLILSKLDFADLVFYPLPQFLVRRLQRVKFAALGFVHDQYVKNFRDILKIGWP